MSEWQERFQSHPVHQILSESLSKLEEFKLSPEDTHSLERVSRVQRVLSHVQGALESIDPRLVTAKALDDIKNPIQRIWEHCNGYLSDRNPNHLNDLDSQAEGLLNVFHFLHSGTEIRRGTLARSVTDFESSANGYLQTLERRYEEFSENLQRLEDLSANIDSKMISLETAIEGQKAKIDTHVSDLNQKFLEAQTGFLKDFNEGQKIKQKEYEDFIRETTVGVEAIKATSQAALNGVTSDAKGKVRALVEDIQSQLDRAKEIVGLISNTGTTGEFLKSAKVEWWNYQILRLASVLLMFAAAWFAYQIIDSLKGLETIEEGHWISLIARVVVTGILLCPAAYCAREASRHQHRERVYRKFQLEISALDSFMESLEETDQRALKKAIIDRTFGQPDHLQSSENNEKPLLPVSTFEEIAKIFRSFVKG